MPSKYPAIEKMEQAFDQAHVAMLGGAPGPVKTLSFSACMLMMSNALAKAYAAGVASQHQPDGSGYHRLIMERAEQPNEDYIPLNYKPKKSKSLTRKAKNGTTNHE